MTPEQLKHIRALRDSGYAVILWAPEELDEASQKIVEDRSIEIGWDIIHDLNGYK